jgi:CheY-like chemotaxis protein
VLIVDDNQANRDQVNAVLTALGAHVAEAVDGEEGVAAANTSAYDVILMDLRMPCLDGVQAAQRIRDGGGPNAATPIIAFSADTRSSGLGDVFDGAVSKPMTAAGLIRALDSAMAAPVAQSLEASRLKNIDR